MFKKIKNVFPLEDYKLLVQFCIGVTKIYDVKPLFKWKDGEYKEFCVNVSQ